MSRFKEIYVDDGKYKTVFYAGPYLCKPKNMIGVKVADNVAGEADLCLPIPDFSIPEVGSTHVFMVKLHKLIREGKPFYIGCLGGKGRTGLICALLLKLVDEIKYQRSWRFKIKCLRKFFLKFRKKTDFVKKTRRFLLGAIETDGQEEFVTNFKVGITAEYIIEVAETKF